MDNYTGERTDRMTLGFPGVDYQGITFDDEYVVDELLANLRRRIDHYTSLTDTREARGAIIALLEVVVSIQEVNGIIRRREQ